MALNSGEQFQPVFLVLGPFQRKGKNSSICLYGTTELSLVYSVFHFTCCSVCFHLNYKVNIKRLTTRSNGNIQFGDSYNSPEKFRD